MSKPAATIALFLASFACHAGPAEMCEIVRGGVIFALDEDVTYIGTITKPTDPDSIFNVAGPFGNKISPLSVWNTYGIFGDPHGEYSATNPDSKMPPIIYNNGTKIGRLTANESMGPWVKLKDLKDLCKDKM